MSRKSGHGRIWSMSLICLSLVTVGCGGNEKPPEKQTTFDELEATLISEGEKAMAEIDSNKEMSETEKKKSKALMKATIDQRIKTFREARENAS